MALFLCPKFEVTMKAIIFDTETTCIEHKEVIEAAWIEIDENLDIKGEYYEQFKPERPIRFGAMATHHIVPGDLVNCRPSSEFKLPEVEYLIGHNIDFDYETAGKPEGVKLICTLALARRCLPQLDSHTQSAIFYYIASLDGTFDGAREVLKGAHNALQDIRICHVILNHLVAIAKPESLEHLYELSEVARIPTVMPFGKHKGLPISKVPNSYVNWLLGQPDIDPYLLKAFGA